MNLRISADDEKVYLDAGDFILVMDTKQAEQTARSILKHVANIDNRGIVAAAFPSEPEDLGVPKY